MKYIYAPTTQGNYTILKVVMVPKLDQHTNEVVFEIKNIYKIGRKVAGKLQRQYKNSECFDDYADVQIFAKQKIQEHIKFLRDRAACQARYFAQKADKLDNKIPKLRFKDTTLST